MLPATRWPGRTLIVDFLSCASKIEITSTGTVRRVSGNNPAEFLKNLTEVGTYEKPVRSSVVTGISALAIASTAKE